VESFSSDITVPVLGAENYGLVIKADRLRPLMVLDLADFSIWRGCPTRIGCASNYMGGHRTSLPTWANAMADLPTPAAATRRAGRRGATAALTFGQLANLLRLQRQARDGASQ